MMVAESRARARLSATIIRSLRNTKFLVEQIPHYCYTTPTKLEGRVAQFSTLY